MGLWYFLILFIGFCLVITGLLLKNRFSILIKIGFVAVGLLCISFSLFMFSPGSAEVIADLLNLN